MKKQYKAALVVLLTTLVVTSGFGSVISSDVVENEKKKFNQNIDDDKSCLTLETLFDYEKNPNYWKVKNMLGPEPKYIDYTNNSELLYSLQNMKPTKNGGGVIFEAPYMSSYSWGQGLLPPVSVRTALPVSVPRSSRK